MYIINIIAGLIIVISSLFMIRREMNRAYLKREQMLEHSKVYREEDLFKLLEDLQLSIDEMNRAFYEIAGDLEGKYAVHEKEIELISASIEAIKQNAVAVDIKKEAKVATEAVSDIKKVVMHHRSVMHHNHKSREAEQPARELPVAFVAEELDVRSKVIELRSQGMSLKNIARELHIGMGEVQLLIQLPNSGGEPQNLKPK